MTGFLQRYPIRPVFQRFLRKESFWSDFICILGRAYGISPLWSFCLSCSMWSLHTYFKLHVGPGPRGAWPMYRAFWSKYRAIWPRCQRFLVEVLNIFGRGVNAFWPRCDFMSWTRSTDCASEVSVVHCAWTRSSHCFSTSSRN